MTPTQAPKRDLARTTFSVLFIGLLLAASLWIVRPFLGPGIWATMVVVASWPLMLRVQRRLFGKRVLAVVVMTLLLLLLFVVPLTMAIVTIVTNADQLIDWAKQEPPSIFQRHHRPGWRTCRWWATSSSVAGKVPPTWACATCCPSFRPMPAT